MPTRPAGSGFSWAEDAGAFVETPPASLVDVGYAPGTVAESLTLNDGLRELGLWSQYVAGLFTEEAGPVNVITIGRVRTSLLMGLHVDASDRPSISLAGAGIVVLSAPSTPDAPALFGAPPTAAPLGGFDGTDWRGWMYGERDVPIMGATAYPEVLYDLSPGLGAWAPWRVIDPQIQLLTTTPGDPEGAGLLVGSLSGAREQRWRVRLPPMPHFSRSVTVWLRDIEIDVSFGASTGASSAVTATLYRYDGAGGLGAVVATATVDGSGGASQTLEMLTTAHEVVAAEGASYAIEVAVDIENDGAGFRVGLRAARMTMIKTGVE